MMARTLRYLFQAKFQYFRFCRRAEILGHGQSGFRLAEVKGFDSDSFTLYDSARGRSTSCADEFLQIMMLANLNTGTLTPKQMDLADNWLKMWSHHLVVEKLPKPGEQQFFVDLSTYSPAQRIWQQGAGRYYRPVLGHRCRDGAADRPDPSRAGKGQKSASLDESFRQPGALDLVKILEAWWSTDKSVKPHRGADRIKVKKLIDVMQGMHDICLHIRYDNERATDLENVRMPITTKCSICASMALSPSAPGSARWRTWRCTCRNIPSASMKPGRWKTKAMVATAPS